MLVQIYRSALKSEMYLYTDNSRKLQDVPESLLQQFGDPDPFMLLNLDGKRRLARVDAGEVVEQIRAQGFFLQMPPSAFPPPENPSGRAVDG